MRPDQRRIAIGAGVTLVAIIVAIGVLLARDRGDAAQPSAVAEDSAPSAIAAVQTDTGAAGGEPLQLSGVDPITGEQVRLADFESTPVVLNFWASWCPPCLDELPALVEFAQRHPEAAVVGVNLQDTPEGARELQGEIGFTFPSIADPDAEIAGKLGLLGMPTTYFLDERHVVRASVVGATDLAGFEDGLELATGSG
jgi:cytochrome c biogenesis protein CcmG, thiol:disulfide interchange protein DsbE